MSKRTPVVILVVAVLGGLGFRGYLNWTSSGWIWTSRPDAVRVGKLVKADWFLLGSPDTLDGKRHAVVRAVNARSVEKIQIAGGYVWAMFDKHLYRAPLP